MKDIYQCGNCKEWVYSEGMNYIHNGGNQLPIHVCDLCVRKVLLKEPKR